MKTDRQRLSASLLKITNEKRLERKRFEPLHVHSEDREIPACFGVVDKLSVIIHVVTFFMDRYVRGIFLSVRKITVTKSKTVSISAIWRKSKTSTNSALANDIITATEAPNENEIRLALQIPPRSE